MVGEFKPENATPPNNDNTVSGSVATSKNIRDKVAGLPPPPPLLAVNVRFADGVWIRANCFLDMGSDTTLVRKQFFNCLGIPHFGSSTLKFGTAGGISGIVEPPKPRFATKTKVNFLSKV